MSSSGQDILCAVRETVVRLAPDGTPVEKIGQVAIEGYFAKADDDADTGESLDLMRQVGGAVSYLLG